MAKAAKKKEITPFLEDGKLKIAKLELYAQVYAQTFNAVQACEAVGLPEGARGNYKDTRYNLHRQYPEINQRIKTIVEQRAADLCLDENWVVLHLMKVFDKAMSAEAVEDHDGNPTGEYVFDGRTSTKVLEMLGSKLGMFDKNAGVQTGGITINMNYGNGNNQAPRQIGPGVTIEGEPQ